MDERDRKGRGRQKRQIVEVKIGKRQEMKEKREGEKGCRAMTRIGQ